MCPSLVDDDIIFFHIISSYDCRSTCVTLLIVRGSGVERWRWHTCLLSGSLSGDNNKVDISSLEKNEKTTCRSARKATCKFHLRIAHKSFVWFEAANCKTTDVKAGCYRSLKWFMKIHLKTEIPSISQHVSRPLLDMLETFSSIICSISPQSWSICPNPFLTQDGYRLNNLWKKCNYIRYHRDASRAKRNMQNNSMPIVHHMFQSGNSLLLLRHVSYVFDWT